MVKYDGPRLPTLHWTIQLQRENYETSKIPPSRCPGACPGNFLPRFRPAAMYAAADAPHSNGTKHLFRRTGNLPRRRRCRAHPAQLQGDRGPSGDRVFHQNRRPSHETLTHKPAAISVFPRRSAGRQCAIGLYSRRILDREEVSRNPQITRNNVRNLWKRKTCSL